SSRETAFWLLAAWLVIGRIGLGMIIPALNVGAVQSLPQEYLAHASASVNFVRQLGGAVGGQPARRAAGLAARRARRIRGGAGLSRLLLGGYDRVCGRADPGAVDKEALSGVRREPCTGEFSSPTTARPNRAPRSTRRSDSRRIPRSRCILRGLCTTLRP